MNISIDDLAEAIQETLESVSKETKGILETASLKVAKDTVKKLKTTSPKRASGGDYAKAWRVSKKEGIVGVSYVVHVAKPHHRLTHVLEYGHALVNGGRAKAIPHIKPAEEEAIIEFESAIREAFK